MLAALLLLLAIYAYFWGRLYSHYLPLRDDPANIGGTVAGGLRGWLTRGMAGYYHVYPEWAQPAFSNFYRPFWNLIIFAEQAILGARYWAWFLVFCALQYLGTLLFLRLSRSLGVSSGSALLFAILFLFNPAFLNSGFIYLGFEFDVFVSLLLLAAVHWLLEGRHGLALALITAAVFTKETAIFAPVAGAMTVLVLKRDLKWSAAMLAPLAAWIAARALAYHDVVGGTFESPAGADVFTDAAQGLIVWPSGAVPASFPLQLTGAYGIATWALILLNVALWAILICASWQVLIALRRTQKSEARLQAVLLLWALGALAFCMFTRPQIRFGSCFYAFSLLFFAYFLRVCPWPRPLKLLPILIVAFATLMRDGAFLWQAMANVAPEISREQALFAGLRSLPQDGRPVFVVNAPTLLSAPVLLARSWRLNLDVAFVSQSGGCLHAYGEDASYRLSPTSLSVELPSCAHYVFAGVPADIQAQAARYGLLRPGVGVYRFPSYGNGKRLSSGDIDFGQALQIGWVRKPPAVLAYDWRDGAYRVLGSGPK